MNTDHIKGFNALRAVSVLLVIASHVGINGLFTHPVWIGFFSVFNANFGVKTFFVLSGFLITTLLIKEHAREGRISIINFMARRALRILPLYYLILVLMAVLIIAGIAESSWTAMAFGILYVYNFIPKGENVNYLSHLWSLAVEEQFYLVWPLLFSLWFGRRGALIAVCLVVIAACFLLWQRDLGWLSGKFYTGRWTFPAIYPISIGCLVALILGHIADVMRTSVALVIALAAIFLPLYVPVTAPVEFVNTFGIAGLVTWIYLNQQRRTVQLLDWGPVGYIGVISYGLYMWQGILTGNGPYRVTADWPPEPILGALLTIPVAALSYHFFEKPISDRRHRFKSGKLASAVDDQTRAPSMQHQTT